MERWRKQCGRLAILFLLATPWLGAAESYLAETLKSAMIYNFAKFVEWPPAAHPVRFCVVGDSSLADFLTEAVADKTVAGRATQVWSGSDLPEQPCEVVFLSRKLGSHLKSLLDQVSRIGVLTVSDEAGFADTGGILEIFPDGKNLRFAANPGTAEQQGVRLSAKLLRLASIRGRPSDGGR